jgi:hypothetical protein
MNEKLIQKTKVLDELKELDALKTNYTGLIAFNGNFAITKLDGAIEWEVNNKLLDKYKALKHKALMVKLKAVDARIKHLNKELRKG